eukprot:TRINITY_DN12_c0_g1_i1.p1 TRINITY_DN12_c0_g1~~TRINITY_DN12_c0_g1_i1.p1  ORF type:complete len:501 (+),score=102.43 TRINITY_DN12_c0_g1_i1:53-1504(+)
MTVTQELRVPGKDGSFTAVAVDHENGRIWTAIRGSDAVYVWDATKYTLQASLTAPNLHNLLCIEMIGKTIWTSSWDTALRIWDADQLRLDKTFPSLSRDAVGFVTPVWNAKRNTWQVWTTSWDKSLCIWEIEARSFSNMRPDERVVSRRAKEKRQDTLNLQDFASAKQPQHNQPPTRPPPPPPAKAVVLDVLPVVPDAPESLPPADSYDERRMEELTLSVRRGQAALAKEVSAAELISATIRCKNLIKPSQGVSNEMQKVLQILGNSNISCVKDLADAQDQVWESLKLVIPELAVHTIYNTVHIPPAWREQLLVCLDLAKEASQQGVTDVAMLGDTLFDVVAPELADQHRPQNLPVSWPVPFTKLLQRCWGHQPSDKHFTPADVVHNLELLLGMSESSEGRVGRSPTETPTNPVAAAAATRTGNVVPPRHQFSSSSYRVTLCDYCHKAIFFGQGSKCSVCNCRVHKKCTDDALHTVCLRYAYL